MALPRLRRKSSMGPGVNGAGIKPAPHAVGRTSNRIKNGRPVLWALRGVAQHSTYRVAGSSMPRAKPSNLVDVDQVMEWREGTVPTGGEVWHIMRLAWLVPGSFEVMMSERAEDCRSAE